MEKGKHWNVTGNIAASEPNSLTTGSPRYTQQTRKTRFGFKITGHGAVRRTQEGHK